MCKPIKCTYNIYMAFTATDLKSTLAFFVWSVSVTGVPYLKIITQNKLLFYFNL